MSGPRFSLVDGIALLAVLVGGGILLWFLVLGG